MSADANARLCPTACDATQSALLDELQAARLRNGLELGVCPKGNENRVNVIADSRLGDPKTGRDDLCRNAARQ
jgi:hypothetical protein